MYGQALRDLIKHDELLVCPGVHDPLTAHVVDSVGFNAVYMTGYGTSLSKPGYPDAGLTTMPEMIENANNIQERVDVPVIADADTGYGNATNVIRTVREYIKTGVGGIHIEDQTIPKRCGHVKGRQLIPREEAVGKIRAAAEVRDDRNEEFVLIARSDARGVAGGSLAEAIERVSAYCDAGADVTFVEGPTDKAEVERIGEAVDAPLVYNCVGAAGTSPYVAPDTLQAMGYNIVIYPLAATQATIAGVFESMQRLKQNGIEALADLDDEVDQLPIEGIHEFSGFPEVVDWEEQYMPTDEAEKYDDTLGVEVTDE
jgi:2-methylisocitrate lyase-like PEP mutase family enzyme